MPRSVRAHLVRLCLPAALVVPVAVVHAQPAAETASLVTRLGADTVAVERFARTGGGIEATVVLRVPRTTVTRYRLDLGPGGALVAYEATTRLPGDPLGDPPGAAPLRRERARFVGDSLRVEVTTAATDGAAATRVRTFAASPTVLPFVDMVHWPFETMLERARASGTARVEQPLFTDRGVLRFVVGDAGGAAMTLTHPTRGTMQVTADARGRLLRLDAGATTRKLIVERAGADVLDLDALARRFAARDAAGQGFGALSGRATPTVALGGATVSLDHGQPSARGRAIFGALVPWGERWRTGADGATHLETDRDLVLGMPGAELRVPAGRYTLSTVPEPGGGVLIVNRQTGQSGTSYDAARDLGRVAMRRETGLAPAERLTLRVVPGGDGAGELRIEWGDGAFVVPVRVAR